MRVFSVKMPRHEVGALVFLLLLAESLQQGCVPRSYGLSSVVCVCNSTYCDTFPPLSPPGPGAYISYTSSQAGLRFHREEGALEELKRKSEVVVTLNITKKYQAIFGWGGAFTDATGINVKSLHEDAQNLLLRSYFSEDGIGYNLCRVPIGGTDFSTHGYSYNDEGPDPDLVNFKLAPEDFEYKIPLIKAAKGLGADLDLFASAWTAPKWMKHNGKYSGPDYLRKEYYQTWVDYFLKFLRAYKAEGIEFWGITTGNEPSTGLVPARIPSVGWLPWQMQTFILENFGPTIRNSEFKNLTVMAIDDQIFYFPWFPDMLLQDSRMHAYVDGFALHWYWNLFFPSSSLTKTHDRHPDKFILATEACEGSDFWEQNVRMGEWRRAETYANDIMNDLNNWVTGWVDWNMAVDPTGGPTYIDNFVDAPIIVNATSGEFYKQPMFYALGHFSKFIPKGSHRVDVVQSSSRIKVVAFIRPDGVISVVAMNSNTWDVSMQLEVDEKRGIHTILVARSITSFLLNE